jgi:hypothetical protein
MCRALSVAIIKTSALCCARKQCSGLLDQLAPFVATYECSGLMKPDTHLGENARQIEVSDD